MAKAKLSFKSELVCDRTYRALFAIYERGKLSVGEIAKAVGICPAAMTRLLQQILYHDPDLIDYAGGDGRTKLYSIANGAKKILHAEARRIFITASKRLRAVLGEQPDVTAELLAELRQLSRFTNKYVTKKK